MCPLKARDASTGARFGTGRADAEISTASKRSRLQRGVRSSDPPPLRLTRRDVHQLLPMVNELRHCTVTQLTDAVGSPGGRSRIQRRLTLLYQHGYLDKISGGPTTMDVYFLARKSPFRALSGASRRTGQLQHVLLINDLRCRIARASRERGLELVEWRDQAAIARLTRESGIIPDGFFVLRGQAKGHAGTAAHFLEAERSPRERETMLTKYRKLTAFFESGRYAQLSGRKSLRVLVVTSSLTIEAEEAWARRLCNLAQKAGMNFGLFASARRFMAEDSDRLFLAPIWRSPGSPDLVSLGEFDR